MTKSTGRPLQVPTASSTPSTPQVKGVGQANLMVKVDKWKQDNPSHANLTPKGVVLLWKALGLIDKSGNNNGGSK